ncbi:peptidase C54, partial [Mycena rosella]
WPAQFHVVLYAQVWCTYRAGFEPIRDLPSLATLPPPLSFPAPPSNAHSKSTSDAGWGSMLRMSQSLLATALQRVGGENHLSHPPPPRSSHQRCLDAPTAPFGVHRMALAGKAARKDVGMWFGPSAVAGALR